MSQLLTPADAGYPPLLKEVKPIPDPLYFSGDITLTDRPTISIIGSRNMSLYGEKVLRMLVPPLVQAGLVIVSGLAYGVDSYAHKVMTEHGGKGIVVLGSGLDTVYPRANQGLFQTIL
ncbi:DNA-processing protein DprA, partial [Patescibacteria group bacterium]|nr:DNA-processing protein DprA [Patescibacteria group bacterium]